ncbi:MAG: radical SAM protein [Eubacteriales bacterium]
MRYDDGLLYRPPGEWKSYLLQVTMGCTHNGCTFCSMYKQKNFKIRDLDEVLEDIDLAKAHYGDLSRVFLCDGDAIILKTDHLIKILEKLYKTFPSLEKVTTYAGPRSTLTKSVEELTALRKAGLGRAYLGVESGSDLVLKEVNKGVNREEMLAAGQNLVAAGIDLWTIVIMGLTGKHGDWEDHILSTAKLINEMKPRHLSCLTFSPEKGTPMGDATFSGAFEQSTPVQIMAENKLLIESLTVEPLHFTSNHASNYLPLKGGLPEDREKFLSLIEQALEGQVPLRSMKNRRL